MACCKLYYLGLPSISVFKFLTTSTVTVLYLLLLLIASTKNFFLITNRGKYFVKCWSELVRKDSPRFWNLGRKLNCQNNTSILYPPFLGPSWPLSRFFTAKFGHSQFKIHCFFICLGFLCKEEIYIFLIFP